ncbi:MAG: hypothetical protein ACM3TU_02390 [Bacillota bacterium]
MKKTHLITSSLGIALLLASAAPALADEGSDDSVTASSSLRVEMHDKQDGKRPLFMLGMPKLKFMASTSAHMERKGQDDEDATSTDDRIENKGQQMHIEKMDEHASVSIDNRIEALQKLSARLASIKLLPADVLAKLQASITSEIDALTALKTSIGTTTATTTLKADLKALEKVTKEHLFAEPKARIAAAASRINAVVTQLTALAGKLETRISDAQKAGIDVTAATSALTDLKAKIADAKIQADAAVSLTADLTVSTSTQATNKATMKTAGQKLVVAQKDLAAARHDAATIIGIVKKGNGEDHATTTATTTP